MEKYSIIIRAGFTTLIGFYIYCGLAQVFIEIINGNEFNILEAFIWGGIGGLLFNFYTFMPILIALSLIDFYIYNKKWSRFSIILQTIIFACLLIYMIYFSEPFCVIEAYRDQCIKTSIAGILSFLLIFSITQYLKYLLFFMPSRTE